MSLQDGAQRLVDVWSKGPIDARIVVLAAHPDDDVIGVGGSIGRVRQPFIVYLTDGAPTGGGPFGVFGVDRSSYKRQRQRYSIQALSLSGIGPSRVFFLNAQDQKASERIAGLSHAFAKILERIGPDAVITHPYEGGHTDHDAARMVAQEAIAIYARKKRLAAHRTPYLLEMTSYHRAQNQQQNQQNQQQIEVGRFLEADGVAMRLTESERERREAMLDAHMPKAGETSRPLDGYTVSLFKGLPDEQIRVAHTVDFDRPPHSGGLYYERGPGGASWEKFHADVRKARAMLPLT